VELSQSKEVSSYLIYETKNSHKLAQTFGVTVVYGGAKEGVECSTPSTQIRSSPKKIIDNITKAKELQVHTKDPNNPTPNESGTPTA
jgi:hypothetical protein